MVALTTLLLKSQENQATLRQGSASCREKVDYRCHRKGTKVQSGPPIFQRRQRGVPHDRARVGPAGQRANEILGTLSPIQRNNYKHATDYDIITLAHSELLPTRSLSLAPETRKKELKDPTFQGYNIINGKQYDGGYLGKLGFRTERHHDRNIHPE